MRYALLALSVVALAGCNPFRQDPIVMYRDGWGGTNMAVPPRSYVQPIPYGASMPPLQQDPTLYPHTWQSGWYLDTENHEWHVQRWVRLGNDDAGNPVYQAVYP